MDVGGLHIYEDETVLVGGFDATAHWFVARYRSGGALDRTFARKGWTELSFRNQDWLNGLVVQADGRIVLVGGTFNGSSNGDFRPVIARLRANGHLDRSFSGDGKFVVVRRRGALAVGVGVQYLTGARIIVGMAGETEFVDAYPLARYLAS